MCAQCIIEQMSEKNEGRNDSGILDFFFSIRRKKI